MYLPDQKADIDNSAAVRTSDHTYFYWQQLYLALQKRSIWSATNYELFNKVVSAKTAVLSWSTISQFPTVRHLHRPPPQSSFRSFNTLSPIISFYPSDLLPSIFSPSLSIPFFSTFLTHFKHSIFQCFLPKNYPSSLSLIFLVSSVTSVIYLKLPSTLQEASRLTRDSKLLH
jgi:hypothetical protein